MSELLEIDRATKRFSDARATLADAVRDLNNTIEETKRQHMPHIKRALTQALAHKENLRSAIEAAPELFVKPRTVVFYGIKVGFAKGKGSIEITDKAKTVELIEKNLPGLAEVLIKVKKSPIKKSIEALDAADLKKIGVTVEGSGDCVVIKPVDSDIDKIIDAFFKESGEEENDLEAA